MMQGSMAPSQTCLGANKALLLHAPSLPRQHVRGLQQGCYTGARQVPDPPQATASILSQSSFPDYYEVLGVDDDCSQEELKSAWRMLAKSCHPDVHSEGHQICVLLNEAYMVLSDPMSRLKYNAQLDQALQDQEDDYTGKPLSKWLAGHHLSKAQEVQEDKAVFVDEVSCIGCKQCVWLASATFRIDPQHGRSRVFAQWVDHEDKVEDAIASCPVDCIHWVDAAELPALEYVTRSKIKMSNVASMMAGQGGAVADVFSAARSFLRLREEKLKKRAKLSHSYSPAQEGARRHAADALRRQRLRWMGPLGDVIDQVWKRSLSSVDYDGVVPEEDLSMRVGRRKRRASVYYNAAPENDSPKQRGFLLPAGRQ